MELAVFSKPVWWSESPKIPGNDTLPGLIRKWIRSSRSPMVFHFLNSYFRWFLWLDKSGKSQCREKIVGFGVWHIKLQNLTMPFFIGVTLGKLLNTSFSFLIHKIWILVMLEVVVKFIVSWVFSVSFSFFLLALPEEMTNNKYLRGFWWVPYPNGYTSILRAKNLSTR